MKTTSVLLIAVFINAILTSESLGKQISVSKVFEGQTYSTTLNIDSDGRFEGKTRIADEYFAVTGSAIKGADGTYEVTFKLEIVTTIKAEKKTHKLDWGVKIPPGKQSELPYINDSDQTIKLEITE